MTEHITGTRHEWEDARRSLLEREKQLTRLSDELARSAPRCPGSRSRRRTRSTPRTARRRSPSSSKASS